MAGAKITDQEWEVFLGVANRLGIEVRPLLEKDVRFHDLESAGHALGRVVAQAATERLAIARAERLWEAQPCPTCGCSCAPVHRDRLLETIDGPIDMREPVCHCPACRRDFFPSASCAGTGSAEL